MLLGYMCKVFFGCKDKYGKKVELVVIGRVGNIEELGFGIFVWSFIISCK